MGYIVIPFYVQGRLVYYTTRRYWLGAGGKFKNPGEETIGIGKSEVVYNVDALGLYKRVRVVESAINSLTIGNSAIALSGKKASDDQIRVILNSPVEELDLILDPDAYVESLWLGLKLCLRKQVRITQLPEGFDVNDLGKKETLSLVEPEFWSYNKIYRKYIDEKRAQHTYY